MNSIFQYDITEMNEKQIYEELIFIHLFDEKISMLFIDINNYN